MRWLPVLTAMLIILALLIGSVRLTSPTGAAPDLTVAAASSLRASLPALVHGYESRNPGTTVRVTYSASGTLAAMIERGAPYDVFLSADLARPQRLESLGLLTESGVSTLAQSRVALVQRNTPNPSTPARIAIPNPRFAPYGQSAKSWLETTNRLSQSSLVYAQSVSHAAALFSTGAVSAAFLDPAHAQLALTGNDCEVISMQGAPPITLAACVILASEHIPIADRFVEDLQSHWQTEPSLSSVP